MEKSGLTSINYYDDQSSIPTIQMRMEHLEILFNIYLLFLLQTFIVFIIELFRKYKNIHSLNLMIYFLSKFINSNE